MQIGAAERRKGLSLGMLGGLAVSFDIPLVRLADGDIWSVQLLRSLCVLLVTTLVWLAAYALTRKKLVMIPGWDGLVVTTLYGVSSVFFFAAVYATPTANLVFILAFNPMFSALLGWAFFGEKPKLATFFAMIIMTIGVFIIVQEGLSGGHIWGDIAAILATVTISLSITISRASGKDMGFTGLISAAVPAMVALWFVVGQGGIHANAPVWILLNGTFVTTTAFFCLSLAPKFVSGPQVAMFYLLETILAPIWVWMIFKEVPTNQALAGGSILLTALVAHTAWELNEDRKQSS